MLGTGATFVKKNSCLVARIVSFDTVKPWNSIFFSSEFFLSTRMFTITRGFIASTRAFSFLTRGFELVNRGFKLVTREFELITRRFELVIRGFELGTRNSSLLFHLVLNAGNSWFEFMKIKLLKKYIHFTKRRFWFDIYFLRLSSKHIPSSQSKHWNKNMAQIWHVVKSDERINTCSLFNNPKSVTHLVVKFWRFISS